MSSPPSWEFAAGKILTICRTHKAEAHGASHPLQPNTAKENLRQTVRNRADNPYRKRRTFSLNQRPAWRENHFLLSARNRVSGRVRMPFGHAHRCALDAKVSAATFSIAPLLHLRVDVGWLPSRAPDHHPIRAAQRIIATTMRVRTAVRSSRDLRRECMQ